jgi:hypothetical protein
MLAQITPEPAQRARPEPLYDIHPGTDVSIEVFYADRTLETFGRCDAGWFWWPRWHGCSPAGPATGPFPTSYAAYRHALNAPTWSSLVMRSPPKADPQR